MTNVTATIKVWAAQGRTFTDARNAGIAHAILNGVKQATIATESGVDKGDVSRINKVIGTLTASQKTAIKRLSFPTDDKVTDAASVAPWAKKGELFRRDKKATAPRAAAEPKAEQTPDGIVRDALAVVLDTIVANPEQEGAWLALIRDLFTPAAIAAQRDAATEVAA